MQQHLMSHSNALSGKMRHLETQLGELAQCISLSDSSQGASCSSPDSIDCENASPSGIGIARNGTSTCTSSTVSTPDAVRVFPRGGEHGDTIGSRATSAHCGGRNDRPAAWPNDRVYDVQYDTDFPGHFAAQDIQL